MNKQEFLARLEKGLAGLPQDDIAERLNFFGEMIDDRMDEGLSEEEAVAGIGTVEEIVSNTVADISITKLVKEKVKPKRRLQIWEIILLVLGSPLWGALLIAVLAVFVSVYAVIWAVLASLWAAEVSFAAGALGGIAFGIVNICRGAHQGIIFLSSGVVLAGLSILFFFVCVLASKAALIITKKIILGIKSMFLRKENEK